MTGAGPLSDLEGPDDEAHLPAEPHPTKAQARIPFANEDGEWASRDQASSRQGAKALGRLGRFQVAMAFRTGRFSRSDRLRSRLDFRRVSRQGRRVSCREFVLLRADAGPDSAPDTRARLGITASRKVGNAIARNRVKRRVREWFRRDRDSLAPGYDWVVIARSSAVSLGAEEVRARLNQLSDELPSSSSPRTKLAAGTRRA